MPKGTSIDEYNRQYVENIVDRINNNPQKNTRLSNSK